MHHVTVKAAPRTEPHHGQEALDSLEACKRIERWPCPINDHHSPPTRRCHYEEGRATAMLGARRCADGFSH